MKIWLMVGVLCLVSVCTYWWARRSQRGEIDELRDSVRSVARSLDDTNRALTRASRPPGAVAEPATAAPTGAVSPAAESGSSGHELAATKQPAIDPATLRAHLGSAFDDQVRDPRWAEEARRQIETKLSPLTSLTALRAVECKATMCRIEMVYDDVEQYQAFLRQLTPEALPWNGTLFSTAAGDPSDRPLAFVAFLAREGHDLEID